LQIPLVALLLHRESFLRLYVINFVLASLGIFIAWQTERGGFGWASCLLIFVTCCFTADNFFFQLDRYPRPNAQPSARPLLLGIGYGLASLLGGLMLYAITPQLKLVSRTAREVAVVQRRGGGQDVAVGALVELVWQTFAIMVALIVALAFLQWLKKKYARTKEGEATSLGGGVMKMVKKIMRPTPRPPEIPRGFSPREQILRGYWAWCDEMERFGLMREASATAKEFAQVVAQANRSLGSPVSDLTALFEHAKYNKADPTRADVESFFARSRLVVETLLSSTAR